MKGKRKREVKEKTTEEREEKRQRKENKKGKRSGKNEGNKRKKKEQKKEKCQLSFYYFTAVNKKSPSQIPYGLHFLLYCKYGACVSLKKRKTPDIQWVCWLTTLLGNILPCNLLSLQ